MPKPATQEHMLAAYRHLSVSTRMKKAVQAVLDKELNQSEAARQFGVTRSKLNVHVQEARVKLAEQGKRAELAKQERAAAGAVQAPAPAEDGVTTENAGEKFREQAVSPVGLSEVRRIQPFREFDQTYFAGLECFDCGRHHETPGFHLEMMDAINDPAVRRLLINMPPGHSKSTIATVKSTVYELCRDPNSMTAIASAAKDLAGKFLYQIARYLTEPGLYGGCAGNLIEDWGPFQGDSGTWNTGKLYIAGRTDAQKDPSVSVYGVGSRTYGIRAHRFILDDIADLENQKNPERVAEMLKWIVQEPQTRVGRNGKLIFVGTRVGAGDVYSSLQKLPGYKVLRYPCIIDEATEETLWPDHYPYAAACEQRDSMTHEQWQLVYQNVDTPGIGASFTQEFIEAARDHGRVLGQHKNWAMIIGLDPAGAGAQAGYTALVLLAVDLMSGKRHIVDMVNAKQLKAPQLKEQLFDWSERYYPYVRELRVESNGLQSQLIQYNEEIVRQMTNKGIRVVPHITTKHNKWDPTFGVEAMAPLFTNRMISTPWGDINSRSKVKELEDQLLAFPMGAVTDLVMALWFAELGAKEIMQRQIAPMFDPRMRIPARLARKRHVVDFAERRVKAPEPDMVAGGRPMFYGPEGTSHKLVNVAGEVIVY